MRRMRSGESLEGLTPLEQTLVTFARKMAADAASIDKEDTDYYLGIKYNVL